MNSFLYPVCSLTYSSNACYFLVCGAPRTLGMESGLISDNQITASSYFSSSYRPEFARLDVMPEGKKIHGWAPASADLYTSWLQVDFKVS